MILSSDPATAWLLYPSVVALLAYVLAGGWAGGSDAAVRRLLVLGCFAHAVAIIADVTGLGSTQPGARFGFGPALSATVWLVVTIHAIESRFLPLAGIRRTLAWCGAAVVALAVGFPGEFRPHAEAAWAPLHWVLGIVSYGLFGAAVLHGLMLDASERALRDKRAVAMPAGGPRFGLPLLSLERLTFRFVGAGFALLTLTIVLGWWYLPHWRWDHKTVFSLLGWCVIAALLAGRQAFGWRGRPATRWLYVGAVLLLLAYVGSRFVFEVVLHRPSVL